MEQYINKDAAVAEIERLIDEIYAGRPFDSLSREQQVALWYIKSIMSSINFLEVKEVESMQEEPKPKFHIGDTIRHKEEKDSFKVLAIEDDCYRLENNIVVSIAAQDHWELVEESVSEDLEKVVKDLWQEINTGHQYSILDSYNQFYGICLDVCDWQKKQMMKEAILRKVKFLDSISYNHCIAHLGMSEEDTVKLILVKED